MKTHKLILTFSILIIIAATVAIGPSEYTGPTAVQAAPFSGSSIVRVYFDDLDTARRVAIWIEPLESKYEKGYLVLEVSAEQYDLLIQAGLEVEIDETRMAQIAAALEAVQPDALAIPGFPCYRTVEETFATAESIVTSYPTLATWTDVGDSWEKTQGFGGYDMMVLRLTNSTIAGPKPKIFMTGAIHAREYTTAELITRLAEYLVDNYGSDADTTWLLDHHEVHLMLHTNPDGRKKAETGLSWRKNTNQNYCGATSNNRGADLNRNFPFKWNCCGGSSGNQCSSTYHGAGPASEPETQAVRDYIFAQFPDQRGLNDNDPAPLDATGIYLDIHSSGRLVLWPWGWTADPAPNGTQLQTLGRKLAFFNGHTPEQGFGVYPTDGTTKLFAYGEMGLAAYTIELGTESFESCTYFENTLVPDNLPSLIYAIKVARTPYMTPAGPDAINLNLSSGSMEPGVPSGTLVTLSATINDTRYNNSNGTEATQNIAATEYYVDVPPWVNNSTPVPMSMSPSDGSFNSTVETVDAIIDTAGWSDGQHILFVRGQDDDGNWGAFSAIFLYIDNTPCSDDNDCNDGLFCNGTETCSGGLCQTGTDPCPGQDCNESNDQCLTDHVENTVGNTLLFSQVSTSGKRRAMPYTMPQSGTIQSITMYHQGGTGRLVLGVYDGNTLPDSRLALTSATPLNSAAGWQTVPLLAPVYVAAGERIWLAWVFEQNPGIRYQSGSPGRAHSSRGWGGGMPELFGSSSTTNYIYSIYADYITGTPSEYHITAVADPGGTIDPSGVMTKAPGEDQRFDAIPDTDYEVDQWYLDDVSVQEGGTSYTLSDIQSNHTMRVTFRYTGDGHTGTVGNTLLFSQVSTSGNRRAMPYTMPQSGTIQSITMYHQGGTGRLVLGVYDGNTLPDSRLALTSATPLNSTAGWQTVPLPAPVYVAAGERIWLAWVFEQNPGIRYQSGSPGRAHSSQGWGGGMPELFGSSSTTNYIYSIYADYITGTVGNTLLFSQVSTSGNRRAMPYTMPQSGTIQSITMYHQGGTGRLVLGVYDGNTLPDSRLALTSATPLNSTAGWQTVPLLVPVYVAARERIWLAWVFEQNPGIRYQSGSPGRAHSGQGWGGGMPELFGSSSTTNYIYSIYADYFTGP